MRFSSSYEHRLVIKKEIKKIKIHCSLENKILFLLEFFYKIWEGRLMCEPELRIEYIDISNAMRTWSVI